MNGVIIPTYQRAMNAIFHDLIRNNMEYIDDVVIKSHTIDDHIENLRLFVTIHNILLFFDIYVT